VAGPARWLALAAGLCLLGGCLSRQPLPAEDPAWRAEATRGLAGRAELVDEANRILRAQGQKMLRAEPGCLVQRYWYLRWVDDEWSFYDLGQKGLPWRSITGAELRCRPGGSCDLRLAGARAYAYVVVPDIRPAAARRLHAVALRLGELAGAPACPAPEPDAALRYQEKL
jgi:hypothetical protein